MNIAALTKKLQTLAVKHDVLKSSLDDATLGAMLVDAARTIATDHDANERASTDTSAAWLDGNGIMLRYEAVELRLPLVDWQFIVRDGFRRAYQRARVAPARFSEVRAAAVSQDFSSLIANALSRDAEMRASRKAAHFAQMAVYPIRRGRRHLWR